MTPHTIHYLHNCSLKEIQENTSEFAQGLSVEIDVSVIDQTVKRILHEVNLYKRFRGEKHYSQICHKTTTLNFAKQHEKNPDEYCQHGLWSDETKIICLDQGGPACLVSNL